MAVLNVVDGVLERLPRDVGDVEVHRPIVGEQEEVEASRVRAHLVDQLVQRDERAGALAHLHRLAAPEERDELVQDDLDTIRVEAERRRRALHPRDVTVVIGSQT